MEDVKVSNANKDPQEEHQHKKYAAVEKPPEINDLPESILETFFTFLHIWDLLPAILVCKSWHHVLSNENGQIWKNMCLKTMGKELLTSATLASCPTFKSKLRAFYHAWNPYDCSRNIVVKKNAFTIHRNPIAQSTDAARGFVSGRHCWEVKWEGPLGTVAVVGVATPEADLREQGYVALLGKDEQSWGWNLVDNILHHDGDNCGIYPLVNTTKYQVGDKIKVILDCEENTLSFEKGDENLGVAFRELPKDEALYPAVSAVYGNSEISMVYLGPPLEKETPQVQDPMTQ